MLESDSPMTTEFKPIRDESVMCTVQGCSEVAAYFLVAGMPPGAKRRSISAAYCDAHAEDAAKRLGHPLPISERKPVEKVARNTRYMVG
jgi:hypothetical protein